MGDWRRCPSCRYIRHVNDDVDTRPDTCPRCGACYDKAEKVRELERRRRSFRTHRNIRTRNCRKCHEPVSIVANVCPVCEHVMGTPWPILAGTVGVCFAAMVGWAYQRQHVEVVSPYPGISNTHFERCVELSVAWTRAQAELGAAATETITLQNDWHAQCSRKALREVARHAERPLPTSPHEWLSAVSG